MKPFLQKTFETIFNLPNIGTTKGYTGASFVQLPNKNNFVYDSTALKAFCKAFIEVYGNRNQWANEPAGSNDETIKSDKLFNKFIKKINELDTRTHSHSHYAIKKNVLPELERYGIIERCNTYFRFRITSLGKTIAGLSIESMGFNFNDTNIIREVIQNRFKINEDWSDYISYFDDLVLLHKNLYWFDLWVLSFSIGDNAIFQFDDIVEITTEIRKLAGLKNGHSNTKLKKLKNLLIEEFGNLNDGDKYQKIDIQNLITLYDLMARALYMTGVYTKIDNGFDLILKHTNNVNLPKTIRNNSTDKSLYIENQYEKYRKTIGIDKHHIIPHAVAKTYNGLSDMINNPLNKLALTKRDHHKIPTQEIDNVYRKIEIRGNRVYLVNPKSKKDFIEIEDTKHFNFKELKRVVEYNNRILPKTK